MKRHRDLDCMIMHYDGNARPYASAAVCAVSDIGQDAIVVVQADAEA
jgi:hypothetical protein